MGADASVIICAFNEEDRIGQLLEALTGDTRGIECKIIVVCNGCQDRTPDIARSFPGVIVEEIADASKHQALNIGDRLAGDVFPRLYADADITIDQQSITRLLHSLNVRRARAVAPSIYYRTTGKPWLVRSYYSTWPRIPNNADWASRHIAGRGVYGTNREGRTRFTDFPPLAPTTTSSTSFSTKANALRWTVPSRESPYRTQRGNSYAALHVSDTGIWN